MSSGFLRLGIATFGFEGVEYLNIRNRVHQLNLTCGKFAIIQPMVLPSHHQYS